MATAIVAHKRSGIGIVGAISLHAVFHPTATPARVGFGIVAGIRIIPAAIIGSAVVTTLIIGRRKRSTDECSRSNAGSNTPTPSRAAPTPAATTPANPSRFLDSDRCGVFDRKRAID